MSSTDTASKLPMCSGMCAKLKFCIISMIRTRQFNWRQGVVADKLPVKAEATPLLHDGPAEFKHDPVIHGHGAKYLNRHPPAGAVLLLLEHVILLRRESEILVLCAPWTPEYLRALNSCGHAVAVYSMSASAHG